MACVVASDPCAAPPDAMAMHRAAFACGIAMHDVRSPSGLDESLDCLRRADIVVDAVLGTGARRPVEQGARVLLEVLAACTPSAAGPGTSAPDRFVVAVDLPSGGCGDTGECDALTPNCALTVTFGLAKQGLGRAPLARLAGRVEVADLGLPLSFRTQRVAGIGPKKLP